MRLNKLILFLNFLMKIAIVKLSALGDIVHTMLVLQFIKSQHKEIIIDWIVEASFKEILTHNPHINNILCVNLKAVKKQKSLTLFWAELKKIKQFNQGQPYDLVIDAQGLLKSAIVAKMLGAKKIVGFDKHSIRETLASRFYHQGISIDYGENVIKRNVFLISQALNLPVNTLDISQKKPFLFIKKPQQFDCLSNDKKNVLLVLGASFPAKQYPVEQYAKITQNLAMNFVIVWGNPQEYALAQKLNKLSNNTQIAPKLSLDGLKSLIMQSDLTLGGDTGPVHMAWGLNKPSITLFGATPAHRNAMITPINQTIDAGVVVDVYHIDKSDRSINNIPSQKIIQNIKEILS